MNCLDNRFIVGRQLYDCRYSITNCIQLSRTLVRNCKVLAYCFEDNETVGGFKNAIGETSGFLCLVVVFHTIVLKF